MYKVKIYINTDNDWGWNNQLYWDKEYKEQFTDLKDAYNYIQRKCIEVLNSLYVSTSMSYSEQKLNNYTRHRYTEISTIFENCYAKAGLYRDKNKEYFLYDVQPSNWQVKVFMFKEDVEVPEFYL